MPILPVQVIGCGVIGLTSAIRLREQGYPVTIITRDLPAHTTSTVAAAIWHPYAVHPIERAMAWGQQALKVFQELLPIPEAGIYLIPMLEAFDHPQEHHWAAGMLPNIRRATTNELPPGAVSGFWLTMPLIQTNIFMPYLFNLFKTLGGKVEQRVVKNLSDVVQPNVLTVNCTGVDAHTVAQDPKVFPIRGQVTRVDAPSVQQGLMYERTGHTPSVTYIFPRQDGVIIGGVAQSGRWDLAYSAADEADVRQRCAAQNPILATAPALGQAVGLRPGRYAVRLEYAAWDGCPVIHNYGHGGAGVTLSWGCAAEVLQLAQESR